MKNHFAVSSIVSAFAIAATLLLATACASKPTAPPRDCKPKDPDKSVETERDGLDRDHIACIIERDALARVRGCYEDTFGDKGFTSEQVRVVTNFRIENDGKVVTANSESPTASAKLKTCVSSVVKNLVFAKPFGDTPVKVSYPWAFRRAAPGASYESIFDN